MTDNSSKEARLAALWEQHRTYRFDPGDTSRPIFSIDTPPPYVSATNLHPGHAMSYTQADIAVRYQRKMGHNVFYPIGFDDNGLPTERFVESKHDVNKTSMPKADFVALCLEETEAQAKNYVRFLQKLGVSVDWTLRYSTISPAAQRIAQRSFLDLLEKGMIERRREPIIWCPACGTALAQSDLEDSARQSQLHTIRFGDEQLSIDIATSRPEYLAACVALFVHPDDERYAEHIGHTITVPYFGHEVEIIGDPEVDPSYGTGAVMVCTWGDSEDVRRWKDFALETREMVTLDGNIRDETPVIGGMTLPKARAATLDALREAGQLLESTDLRHEVKCHERCGTASEFVTTTQWFIKVADNDDLWMSLSAELKWYPEFMKTKLDAWIKSLKYDWCISRQRYYGVPFPVWFCGSCGATLTPPADQLPVDPTETEYPRGCCTECGSTDVRPDTDVMDTWMTSSLTPFINGRWGEGDAERMDQLYPMDLRVQAFEIIRTWLFYTLIKGQYHMNQLPWKAVLISGWGLDMNGKKISKSSGAAADAERIIDQYSADALRYWASGAELGSNHRFSEQELKMGRRLVTKLTNAARFVGRYLADFNTLRTQPGRCSLAPSDIWTLQQLQHMIREYHRHFASFDYFKARKELDAFFWDVFCDNYLEFVKPRFRGERAHGDRQAALATLEYCLGAILHLYAPYIPFATEELYQEILADAAGWTSIHALHMPQPQDWIDRLQGDESFEASLVAVEQIRKYRSAQQVGFKTTIGSMLVDGTPMDSLFLQEAMNIRSVGRGPGSGEPFLNTPSCRIWFDME